MNEKQQEQFDHTIPSRVAKIETDQASMRSDIRGIFAGLDEIRDVLVRMQENARPNLGGMIVVIVALCTFLVTVGGLAMAPIYRDNARMANEIQALQQQQIQMMGNRFTDADGKRLEAMVDRNARQTMYLYGRAGLDYPD